MSFDISVSRMRGKNSEERLAEIYAYIDRWNYAADWCKAISYIINEEQEPYQSQFLTDILDRMSNVDPEMLQKSLDGFDIKPSAFKNFSTLLLLLRHILTYECTTRLEYVVSGLSSINLFEDAIDKIIESGGSVPVPASLIADIQTGIYVIPKLYNQVASSYYYSSDKVMDTKVLNALAKWILIYPVTNTLKCFQLADFAKFIVNNCQQPRGKDSQPNFELIMQLLIIVMTNLAKRSPGSENYFMFFEYIKPQMIRTILVTFQENFLQFNTEEIFNVFDMLTQATVAPNVIEFLLGLSNALKNEGNFGCLKQICEGIIIHKILLENIKFTRVAQKEVQDLVSFYIQGFLALKPSLFNPTIMKHFCNEIERMSETHRSFWVRLAASISNSNRSTLQKIFIDKFGEPELIVSNQDYQSILKLSWNIQEGDLTPKKKYKTVNSDITSIKYTEKAHEPMIGVMHALFCTRVFPELLHKFQKYFYQTANYRATVKISYIYESDSLFEKLKNNDPHANIMRIILNEEFRKQQQPLALPENFFETYLAIMENSAKRMPADPANSFKSELADMFRLQIRRTTICTNCSNSTPPEQLFSYSYFLSREPQKVELSKNQLVDRQKVCQFCKQKNKQIKETYSIVNRPDFIVLGIKRIHDYKINANGPSYKKDYSNRKAIPRFIYKESLPTRAKAGELAASLTKPSVPEDAEYRLQGFVSHNGANQDGHWSTQYRKGGKDPKVWIEFSEGRTIEFTLGEQNQPFELSRESTFTPILLFYKKLAEKKNLMDLTRSQYSKLT